MSRPSIGRGNSLMFVVYHGGSRTGTKAIDHTPIESPVLSGLVRCCSADDPLIIRSRADHQRIISGSSPDQGAKNREANAHTRANL